METSLLPYLPYLYSLVPISRKYFADFVENGFYHVYNRTNNKERLFRNQANYTFFLKKFDEYFSGYIETLGWCLLPNHFHILIRINPTNIISKKIESITFHERNLTQKRYLENRCSLSELLESVFKSFFQSYAMSFNKMFNRKGNLFYKCFKRVRLDFNEDIIRTLVYIHRNPVKHGFTQNFTTYRWSSWKFHECGESVGLKCCNVLQFFRDKTIFFNFHKEIPGQENNHFY